MGTQVIPATPTVDQKLVAEMNSSVAQLVAMAKDCEVTDNDGYLASGVLLEHVLAKEKTVNEFFEQPAKAAFALHKWITSMRGAATSPLQRAAEQLKMRRKDYRAEQERRDREREEEERKKARKDQEDAALAHAAELEKAGETEAANFVLDSAANAPTPAVVLNSSVPKEAGHSIQKVWKYRIKDAALIKVEFKSPDDSLIQPIVDSLGPAAVAVIGGIEVYPDEIERVTKKK